MRRRERALLSLAALVAVLLALRLAAPWAVQSYLNRELAQLGDYRGSVGDVDLSLLRGGYVVHDLLLEKASATRTEQPFATIPRMDLSLQWPALARGRAVGELKMHGPQLNLVRGEAEDDTQLGTGVNWPEEIRDLFPFRLNVVEVHDGLVTFRAPGIETNESLTIHQFELLLRNLTNVQDVEEPAFAELTLTGRVMGNSPLEIAGRIDPNAQAPTFDIDLSLQGAQLVDVNPWLEEFVGVDAEAGAFSLFAELAAAEGRFEGYLKPIMENPEIFDPEEPADGPFQKAWEALVGLATKILENRQEEQVATQIPFRGDIENPQAGMLAAMTGLVRNAFVAAFARSLEGTISLSDVSPEARALGDTGGAAGATSDAAGANDTNGTTRRGSGDTDDRPGILDTTPRQPRNPGPILDRSDDTGR